MRFVKRDSHFFDRPLPDPGREPRIQNLNEAAAMVWTYINDHPGGRITIVGDYDSDGINATAILCWALKKAGVIPVMRIPRRFSEGYGMSVKIIDEIPEGLVIAIDNGISSWEAIQRAKDKGLTVLVIDHHLPPVDLEGRPLLPPADLIVDPHVDPDQSEFVDYCGSGLALRFALAMFPGNTFKSLRALAAIATVTDSVPMVGANWALVREGIVCVNDRSVVPGLKVLLTRMGLDDHIDEEDFGYKLGPVFNASGRVYDNGSDEVVQLLTARAMDRENPTRADHLVHNNVLRQEMVRKASALADKIYDGSRPIVLYDPAFPEGIVGILAGNLCESCHAPAVVFTDTKDPQVLKGSGRSIPEVNMKHVLDQIRDTTVSYGGHAGAAGISVRRDMLPAFREAFAQAVGELPEHEEEDVYYDEELDLGHLAEIWAKVAAHAPYGENNPRPVFHMVHRFRSYARRIGDGSHFQVREGNITINGFHLAQKYFDELGAPGALEMTGHLSEHWFRGSKSFEFEILAMDAVQ